MKLKIAVIHGARKSDKRRGTEDDPGALNQVWNHGQYTSEKHSGRGKEERQEGPAPTDTTTPNVNDTGIQTTPGSNEAWDERGKNRVRDGGKGIVEGEGPERKQKGSIAIAR